MLSTGLPGACGHLLPNPRAAQAFCPQCWARRHMANGRVPRPQGGASPGWAMVGGKGRRLLPLASSSCADLVPCFLLGLTSFVQMAPLSFL